MDEEEGQTEMQELYQEVKSPYGPGEETGPSKTHDSSPVPLMQVTLSLL